MSASVRHAGWRAAHAATRGADVHAACAVSPARRLQDRPDRASRLADVRHELGQRVAHRETRAVTLFGRQHVREHVAGLPSSVFASGSAKPTSRTSRSQRSALASHRALRAPRACANRSGDGRIDSEPAGRAARVLGAVPGPDRRLGPIDVDAELLDKPHCLSPDGHGRLELTKFRNPRLIEIKPAISPPNTLGLRSVHVYSRKRRRHRRSPARQRRRTHRRDGPVRGQVQTLLRAKALRASSSRWPRNSS
jgi:hypothetical protein